MGFSEDRARGKYGPRYVLTAENGYLLWDAIEDWKRVWRENGHIPLDTFRAPKIDYDRLLDVGATIPMFGEVRLVVIQDAERVTDKQQKRLLDALARFGDSTKVLVTAHKLDKRKKIFKGLKAWGDLEEFPRIYDNQVPGWAKRIAGDFGWQLAPDAAGLLATTFGDDLFSVRQTIERATLYIGNRRRIETADVEVVLAGEGTHTVFLLLNALGNGDLSRSLAIVRSLFAGQDQPHLWLAALSSLLQRLLRLAEIDEPDKYKAATQTGIHHRFIDQARGQVRHFQARGLTAAILACFETEWAIKTSRVTPRLGWELLVYRLCSRRALNGPPFFDLENPELGE